jgi:hypothetical protein
MPIDTRFKSTPVAPHAVATSFHFHQKVLEGLKLSSYVSDDEELSDLSDLSDSDWETKELWSGPSGEISRETQPPIPQGSGIILSRAEKRKARCKEKSKRNNKKRKTKAQREYREDSKITTKHTRNANATASNYNASNFGIASTGYIGKRAKEQPVAYALGEMVGEDSKFNFELKKWDGRLVAIYSEYKCDLYFYSNFKSHHSLA